MVRAAEDPQAPELGAVAALVSDYAGRRGASKRWIAGQLGVERQKVMKLMSGRQYAGRYLGLRMVGSAETPFLRRVAELLEIPDDELTRAVAFDLGIIGAASSTGRAPDF